MAKIMNRLEKQAGGQPLSPQPAFTLLSPRLQ